MIDISSETSLVSFISGLSLFPEGSRLSVHYFSGGVSCVTALVYSGSREYLVKQPLAKLKVKEDWECSLSRMEIEYKAMEVYARYAADAVPKPVLYDTGNFIMVREAAPQDCIMWKTSLLEGDLNFLIARKAAVALASVHNGSFFNAEVQRDFSDLQFFSLLRIDPYIRFTADKHPEIRSAADKAVKLLTEQPSALVHGDFSPKNILVRGNDLYLLDMEVAHYGNPVFDVAFFLNHFLLKGVLNKQMRRGYFALASFILETYQAQQDFADNKALETEMMSVLPLLFLARVDGKSPVEYLVSESDRQRVRQTAIQAVRENCSTLDEFIQILNQKIIEDQK